ncbi:uncharacterized protein PAC_01310 [Phialocephala subalpina]|uniref:Heterokaryon incompatibility domain-containing protein n=1 Tax=Phialocephala subalpina TaxID=576137 RepID=A0A1L7WF77_9HELO|nr:uncharacterized protein PAC_01310 [Phialocephala subalpina]
MYSMDNVGVRSGICRAWRALGGLLQTEWFNHVWVIQEAALPTKIRVFYGGFSMPWSKLYNAVIFAKDIPFRPLSGMSIPRHIAAIEKIREELASPTEPLHLPGVLLRLSRSRISGLHSLNYNENVFRPLCTQVAKKSLKGAGNLNILSGPLGNLSDRTDWASWILDWAADNRPNCLLLDQPSFQASNNTEPVVEFQDDNVLGLEGFVFDHIEVISEIVDKGPPRAWTRQQYRKRMEDMVLYPQCCLESESITKARSKEKYVTGEEDILDAYWKTLLGGHQNSEAQRLVFQRFDMISKHGARILREMNLPAWPWILVLTPMNLMVGFFRALVKRRDYAGILRVGDFTSNPNHGFMLRRRLVRTQKGYIGLVPSSAQVGDAVGLLKEARCPCWSDQTERGGSLLASATSIASWRARLGIKASVE